MDLSGMQPSTGGFLMKCQKCGNEPAVMVTRAEYQRAIVCGGCILDQYIEWTEDESDGESE